MKLILLAIIFALAPTLAYGQEQNLLRDEMKLKLSSGESGHAKLSIEKTALQRGERYAVEYTFYNTCSSYWIYNFSFNRLLPLPGQLAIYDADKKYIGDLVAWEEGSRRSADDNDWVFLYGGTHIGSNIGFKAGYVPRTKYGLAGDLLPTGRYHIQLILYKAFFTVNPSYTVGDKPDFYKRFDKSEAVPSNVIEIQIVENNGGIEQRHAPDRRHAACHASISALGGG